MISNGKTPVSDADHVQLERLVTEAAWREAEGVTILTVFMDDETSSSVPWVVGEDHDRFVRTEQGWRFKSRQWKPLFARPKA